MTENNTAMTKSIVLWSIHFLKTGRIFFEIVPFLAIFLEEFL